MIGTAGLCPAVRLLGGRDVGMAAAVASGRRHALRLSALRSGQIVPRRSQGCRSLRRLRPRSEQQRNRRRPGGFCHPGPRRPDDDAGVVGRVSLRAAGLGVCGGGRTADLCCRNRTVEIFEGAAGRPAIYPPFDGARRREGYTMIRLRPALWPTLLSLPMMALCLGLGIWQLERREWKRDILDR